MSPAPQIPYPNAGTPGAAPLPTWCSAMQRPLFTAGHSGTAPVPPRMCSSLLWRSALSYVLLPYCGSCPRRSGVIHTCVREGKGGGASAR